MRMKMIAVIFGIALLCIASFLFGHRLAMSQARDIAQTSLEVAASQMASGSLVRVATNSRILDSIKVGKTNEAIEWACKALFGAQKNRKELSGFNALNKENIRKAIEMGDKAYVPSCGTNPR
jgi:hypothetical protein